MKRFNGWIILLMTLTSPSALAQSTFDPGTLGYMRAVLALCSKSDWQEASQYLLKMKSMIGNASRQTVEKAEKSEAYRIAYQSVRSELSNRDPRDRAAACSSYLSDRH